MKKKIKINLQIKNVSNLCYSSRTLFVVERLVFAE